jgi:general secretion pathway protein G
MERLSEQYPAPEERGDTVRGFRLTGHRVALYAALTFRPPARESARRSASGAGFTIIELVISITILTILTLGVVPLVKVSLKRQREQQLHETLRSIRAAIDEFHRDTVGMPNCPAPPGTVTPPPDPRSRVVISDCTIFGVDNPERYPPDLETLYKGVNVTPRVPVLVDPNKPATEINQLSTKQKVYLRAIPVDPITGKAEWDVRSCYDLPDSDSTGGENVFDVRSKSKETALNGEKYSDW